MNWGLILFPIWGPLLWIACLLLLVGIFDHFCATAQRRENDRLAKIEQERKAKRTPKQADDEARGACVAMCGFDPGPSPHLLVREDAK